MYFSVCLYFYYFFSIKIICV